MQPARTTESYGGRPRTNAFRFKGEHVHCDGVSEAATVAPTAADCSQSLHLLGDLSDAIALVTVAHRSLEAKEIAEAGDEEVALRYAISLLQSAYSALDMASLHSNR